MNEIVVQRLQFFTIHTRDLGKARQFYVEVLGFPIVEEREGEFFQVSIAGVPVCVDLDTSFTGQPNQIGITVGDLESTMAALRKRGLAIAEGRSTKDTWRRLKIQTVTRSFLLPQTPRKHEPRKSPALVIASGPASRTRTIR